MSSAMIFAFFGAVVGIISNDLGYNSSRLQAPNGFSFQAGYAVHGNGTWATEFYIRQNDGQPNEWVVRKGLVTPNGREQVSWITSSSCSIVSEVALSLNRVALGSVWVPEPSDKPRMFVFPQLSGPSADSDGYSLWGSSIQGNGIAQFRVDATTGTSADWVRAADRALESCWPEVDRN
jgi:hypothetical protein